MAFCSKLPLTFTALALIAFSSSALAEQPQPSRVRGAIQAVDGETVTIKSREGADVNLHIASSMGVTGVAKVALADIKVGSFIGATSVPEPDGTEKAVEVHVFPENMRGSGEGSQPYDLLPKSSMTNATVDRTKAAANDGQSLTLKYKGGEKKVVIGPDTPVVTFVPGDKSELKAGAQVIAFATKRPDGSLEARRMLVGRDGITPPM
ncbi:MAG: hypothetical protein JSS22_07105 [Proteobacteria bacterium]|nr:hypothetical protein [Pseudomonadota bacterium]